MIFTQHELPRKVFGSNQLLLKCITPWCLRFCKFPNHNHLHFPLNLPHFSIGSSVDHHHFVEGTDGIEKYLMNLFEKLGVSSKKLFQPSVFWMSQAITSFILFLEKRKYYHLNSLCITVCFQFRKNQHTWARLPNWRNILMIEFHTT